MININIEFNNRTLTLPVNPEELEISRSADNEKVKIIGLGNIIVKKEESLDSVSIESFFPSVNSEFYTGVSPRTCVEFINTIWKSSKIARIVSEGLPINLNMYFVIDDFTYDSKAGEEDDIYYSLKITKYIPYGARLINMQGNTINGIIEPINRVNNKPIIEQTYTIKEGDSLIGITKKITGDTSKWKELYLLNTSIIGLNPINLIVGLKLTLPESWVTS